MKTRVEMFSPPRRSMQDETKLWLALMATAVAIALIIAGGVLAAQWMDIHEVKQTTLQIGYCR